MGMQANAVAVNRCQHILSDLRASGTPDFAKMVNDSDKTLMIATK